MQADPTTTSGRVVEQQYTDLTEGHRTTLVVGMMDMFDLLTRYLDPAFEPIAEYAHSYESGDLRELFDRYLQANPSPSRKCAIASSFLSMLIEKSGHGLKPRPFLVRVLRAMKRP